MTAPQFGVTTFRARCCGMAFEGEAGVTALKAHNKTTKHVGRATPPRAHALANGKPTRWRVPARRLPVGAALVEYQLAMAPAEYELAA